MEATYWNIIQGCGTLAIGAIALNIARQQSKTNQRKLKFDLFEKRMAVYRDFQELWMSASSIIMAQNDPFIVDVQFEKIMDGAKFIFDERMRDELTKLHSQAIDYQCLFEDKNAAEHGSEKWSEIIRELKSTRKTIDNISKNIEKEFKNYLDFSKIK